MPVTSESVAAQPLLKAEDVDRGRLFPEGPLGLITAVGRMEKSTPSTSPSASHLTSHSVAGSPEERAPNSA